MISTWVLQPAIDADQVSSNLELLQEDMAAA